MTDKQRRPRKPTLVGVAKQFSKADIEVKQLEERPDGTIVVVIGKPDNNKATNGNPWDEVLKHEQH